MLGTGERPTSPRIVRLIVSPKGLDGALGVRLPGALPILYLAPMGGAYVTRALVEEFTAGAGSWPARVITISSRSLVTASSILA